MPSLLRDARLANAHHTRSGAVAVVFILEVDNVIYKYGIPQIMRCVPSRAGTRTRPCAPARTLADACGVHRYDFEVNHRMTITPDYSNKLEKIKSVVCRHRVDVDRYS